MAPLTDKGKQQNPKHRGGHLSKKDHAIIDTGSRAMCTPRLGKVKTGGSIYIQMPKVKKAITISDDSESNEEQEQESKQQPKDKQPEVETNKDKDDEDEEADKDDDDDEDEQEEDGEEDYMPNISRDTVDGYVVSIIGHLEEYT